MAAEDQSQRLSRETVTQAIRRWVEQNAQGLDGFTGAGVITLSVHFNTAANNGRGEIKVRLGN